MYGTALGLNSPGPFYFPLFADFHAQILTATGRKKWQHFTCHFGASKSGNFNTEKGDRILWISRFQFLFSFLIFHFQLLSSGMQSVRPGPTLTPRSSQRLARKSQDTLPATSEYLEVECCKFRILTFLLVQDQDVNFPIVHTEEILFKLRRSLFRPRPINRCQNTE